MIFRNLQRFVERRRLINQVLPYTLVGKQRIQNLYALAQRIEDEAILGDVVECGVCNGGTAAILARSATRSPANRLVWLLDSFQGMPGITPKDERSVGGESADAYVGKVQGDPGRVNEVLRLVGADFNKVRIVPGWFEDTFALVSSRQLALLNIDADWYESVKLCLETFYDRIVRGGFVSIDDYGHWPGCKKAVDEFFMSRGLSPILHQVDYTARWFRKE